MQGINLKMGPLNYLFMHTAEAGAYCLGIFDNGQAGTLLGGITFRNILVEVRCIFADLHCTKNHFLYHHIKREAHPKEKSPVSASACHSCQETPSRNQLEMT